MDIKHKVRGPEHAQERLESPPTPMALENVKEGINFRLSAVFSYVVFPSD